jgi:hypothetical protein
MLNQSVFQKLIYYFSYVSIVSIDLEDAFDLIIMFSAMCGFQSLNRSPKYKVLQAIRIHSA